jgi:hypothetical protein
LSTSRAAPERAAKNRCQRRRPFNVDFGHGGIPFGSSAADVTLSRW